MGQKMVTCAGAGADAPWTALKHGEKMDSPAEGFALNKPLWL